ncbi:MAG: hypothetical protein ONB05_02450 [candidate division KSB1 bacterium]|nr:hypothetical protein [candidate division KSB1 bacterium]
MSPKLIVWGLIFALFCACATSRYGTADKLLESGQYQEALREYLRIQQTGGTPDVRTLLGMAIANYHLKRYGKCAALVKQVLLREPRNGCALYYAGSCLEIKGKPAWALKTYQRYHELSRLDPYRRFLKARYTLLLEKELENKIRVALKSEDKLAGSRLPDNTIAVLYFLNAVSDPQWTPLSKGLAEMMITDFSQVKKLNVVERIQLQKLIDEMQLGQSGLMDPQTVPRLGQLLRARILVNGAFSVEDNQKISLTTSLTDVALQKTSKTAQFTGALENIFMLEKDLVLRLLEDLGIPLSIEERERIMQIPTRNLQAFMAYCNGLEQMDRGDYANAADFFEQAVQLDPRFSLAAERHQTAEAISLIQSGEPLTWAGPVGSYAPVGLLPEGKLLDTRSRLGQMSLNLDLGYLPSNDSRRDASELSARGYSPLRHKLSKPPEPPQNP